MQRDASLQLFLDMLEPAVLRRTPEGSTAARVAGDIFSRLRLPGEHVSFGVQQPLPAHKYLAEALSTGRAAAPDLASLSDAFDGLAPQLRWTRRETKGPGSEDFARGHANTYIIGPTGTEQRKDVLVGASLMAPDVQYVDHHHPPAEVYLVLSPGWWRQEQKPWWEPGIGGIVYNHPHVVHAMKSGSSPLFAIWCLLVEEAEAA